MKSKTVSIRKNKKDSLEKILSFKNYKQEIRLLSEIVNQSYLDSIKESLQVRGISQSNLAEDIHVSKSYVSQIFNGNRHLNISFITSIRRKYAIPLELIDTSRYFSNATFIVFSHGAKKIENDVSNTIDIPFILATDDSTTSETVIFKKK